MPLNTSIRGMQIKTLTISGGNIVDSTLTPRKIYSDHPPASGLVLTYITDDLFRWELANNGTLRTNESPSGDLNSVNMIFTLLTTPTANSLQFYINGLLQEPGVGNDYTISGSVISCSVPPESGDILLVSYLTSSGISASLEDHGSLSGLSDDDHVQYHTNARGDARYYTEAEVNVISGAIVAQISASGVTDHGLLTGLSDDDHTQYVLVNGTRSFTSTVSGISPTVSAHLSTKGYIDTISGAIVDKIPNTGQLYLSAAGGWPTLSSGCGASVQLEFSTNKTNIYYLPFDPNTKEYAQWFAPMPSNWDESYVTAVFYWTCSGAGAGETIRWSCSAASCGDGNNIDQTPGNSQVANDTFISNYTLHVTSGTSNITVAGAGVNEMTSFKIAREVANDNLAVDGLLLGAMINYSISL